MDARKAEVAADKTLKERSKKEFWGMFDGYCKDAPPSDSKTKICTNALMLKTKAANHMPAVKPPA